MIRTVLLQAGGQGFDPMTLLLWGGIFVVFYFFMIRPQQKKAKDQKKFISEIKKGDSIVTTGGIHGKVFSVEDETVTIEVDKSTKLTLEKSSISLEASKREKK
ncbi:MAG: preprotein translocase subunit YajC [Cyclobacteriaceae bacterium]|nr:preprotein translocase subunit YajC [Cyclobacteriaceae bacterium]